MPALATDIGPALREARIESWQDAGVKARYPNARDGGDEPATGYFDTAADAVTAISARGALLGTERRRFKVVVGEVMLLDLAAAPTVTLIDPEQSVAAPALVTRIEINLETQQTLLEVMV